MAVRSAGGARASEALRGLILLSIALPLFFFPNLINLYRLPKEALLAFLTAVLAGLFFLDSLREKEKSPPGLPLLLPICLYLFFSGLSLTNALNLYQGIFRLLSLTLGIGLFWITANAVDRDSVRSLLRWITITGSAVALVGIIQTWGVEIPTLVQAAVPSSTFGNKNMAAQHILFVLPPAFYLLLSAPTARQERLYGALAALIVTYLVYTGTRAAWGAFAAALIALWYLLRAKGFAARDLLGLNRRQWRSLLAIALFVTAMNTIPRYFIPNFGAYPTWSRLRSMAELGDNPSAQARFAIWANSLAIFKDHPLLGAGVGNFQFVYPLYNHRVAKDPTFGVEAKAAEAHNDYVQLLAETGLLGTTAFLWILLLLARRYWRALDQDLASPVIPVGLALTAILLHAFWDFPFAHPVSTAFFWIYAGLLFSLSREEPATAQGRLPRGALLAILALLVLCNIASSILSFSRLRAEYYYSRALFGEYGVENIDAKLALADKDLGRAIRLHPYDYRPHLWKAILQMRRGQPSEALRSNRRALSLNPYDINTLNNLGIIYAALGDHPKAIQALQAALALWPDYVNAHNHLGRIYEKIGEREKALQQYQKSLDLHPENRLAAERLAALRRGP